MASIRELAQKISVLAGQVETFGNSALSNAANSQTQLQELDLINSIEEMGREILGPRYTLMEILHSPADVAPLLIVHELNLPQRIPPSGSISKAELAMWCNSEMGTRIEGAPLRRFICYMVMTGLFKEP
ncbi:uncharacterized protein CC84DRAFT_1217792 [Paraphaeosphaeria sporulosa]|uniref:Uncharacterized protein n=1 Tax=Paraphaeosphaeria sporulosa TaxID=1460663 RepID=A0A177CAW5_9PLEO|nr:uncharacterized protein CC84DRAFT_1217792 [Paraphaeosphaeria sporulosa]OAG04321.1 hypothetical protein CC84DRAFT_1217792 [Paraphaeosphaeria sporulosa]